MNYNKNKFGYVGLIIYSGYRLVINVEFMVSVKIVVEVVQVVFCNEIGKFDKVKVVGVIVDILDVV